MAAMCSLLASMREFAAIDAGGQGMVALEREGKAVKRQAAESALSPRGLETPGDLLEPRGD
jgi:hypothetical protein